MASVVRVNLDGSNAQMVRAGLNNPNAVAVIGGEVYYVDSHYKTRGDDMDAPTGVLYRQDAQNGLWVEVQKLGVSCLIYFVFII